MNEQESYWSTRYSESRTGWDIGYPATPLKEYIDQLEDKEIKILIPGAGNAYEAEYLFNAGFKHTFVLDISTIPLKALQKRIPSFPDSQLVHEDFFAFEGQFDLIIEQTFFCSLEPTLENRSNYAKKMDELLRPNGKLVGVWFDHTLIEEGDRPFGGTKEEYTAHLSPYFNSKTFERCSNSIEPRKGQELFGIFIKK